MALGLLRADFGSSGPLLASVCHLIFRPDLASSGPLPALFRANLGMSGLLVVALSIFVCWRKSEALLTPRASPNNMNLMQVLGFLDDPLVA